MAAKVPFSHLGHQRLGNPLRELACEFSEQTTLVERSVVLEEHFLDFHAFKLWRAWPSVRGRATASPNISKRIRPRGEQNVVVHAMQPETGFDVAAVLGEQFLHVRNLMRPGRSRERP